MLQNLSRPFNNRQFFGIIIRAISKIQRMVDVRKEMVILNQNRALLNQLADLDKTLAEILEIKVKNAVMIVIAVIKKVMGLCNPTQ